MLRPADSLPAVPICPGKSPSTGHFCCPSYAHRAPISHAPLAHAPRRTALTSAEMSPARESGRSAGPWNTAGLWNATGAWNTLGAWNIAVRTRGVFTHRDGLQKPACVERGLVRTAMERGETKRRKPERTESDDNRDGGKQGKAEGRGGRARGQKKRSRGEKASKKCSNMAKRAQIASLAISMGGGKKTIFATGGTSGAEKYRPEEKERRD